MKRKIDYILSVIFYVITGIVFGFGIIEPDPAIKIPSAVALMIMTILFVYNTWSFLFKQQGTVRK